MTRRDDAITIVRTLREAGHTAFFAGGCVRDMLLGVEPKDFDVATDATPDRVRSLFRRTQAVGQAFGVILVREGKSTIEVATFRSDDVYLDGRRPSKVHFSSPEEDAQRRDFTINGLFFDPLENRVIDYVNGQADLNARVIRAIGDPDARFAEDHLRLLRAIRFSARLNFAIEPVTSEAITRNAPHLVRISPERIAEELRSMLTAPTRTRAWELLQQYTLDNIIFRFLRLAPDSQTSVRRLSIVERLLPGQPVDFGLALAAAAVEVTLNRVGELKKLPDLNVRNAVDALRKSLRISNDESDMMEGTLYGIENLLHAAAPSVATLKRFLARPTASRSRALLAALPAEFVPQRETLQKRLRELEKTEFAPAPFITGDDLIAAGFQPGKLFKRVLDGVYDAQLESQISSKEEAMRLAHQLAQSQS